MNERGFTLTELMITVVVIGILAAIAIPSYLGYVQRTRRTDAVTALQSIALYEEKYMAENGQYSDNLDTLKNKVGYSAGSETDYYTLTVSFPEADKPSFLAKAEPKDAGKTGDIVFALKDTGQVGKIVGGNFVEDNDLWSSLRK